MQNSNSSAKGLPMAWVEKLFEKLAMIYGHQFLGRWSGLDLAKVKADWSHELDGLEKRPKAITYALQNLPTDNPPTVLQFRELCRRAPEVADVLTIEAPKPDPERLAAAVVGIRKTMAPAATDHLKRQREHMRMEMGGMRQSLTARQREFWRIALRAELLSKTGIDTAQPFDLAELAKAVNARAAA